MQCIKSEKSIINAFKSGIFPLPPTEGTALLILSSI